MPGVDQRLFVSRAHIERVFIFFCPCEESSLTSLSALSWGWGWGRSAGYFALDFRGGTSGCSSPQSAPSGGGPSLRPFPPLLPPPPPAGPGWCACDGSEASDPPRSGAARGGERPLRRFRREGDSHHVSQNVSQRGKAVVQRHWARCLFVFVFLRYFTPLPLLWTLEDGDIVTHLSWAAELWPEPKACPEASALAWSTSYFVLLVPSTQSSLD